MLFFYKENCLLPTKVTFITPGIMTLWSYEYGQKLLQKPVSQACPQTIHSQHTVQEQFFIEDGKIKLGRMKFLTMGVVGLELFCPHGHLRSKARKDNKSARRVQMLCEGLTPFSLTLYVSESNAGSCNAIKIYTASSGWRRSCTL